MQNREKIDKIPRMCSGPEELQAGDILIFDHVPHIPGHAKNHSAFFTVQQQGFLNERGGHKESVHAGFIVDTEHGLKLAHLVGDGFMLDDLDPQSEHFSKFLKRTTHVYRPRRFRQQLAAQLAEVVKSVEFRRGEMLRQQAEGERKAKQKLARIKWTAGVAVRSFVNRLVGSLKIMNQRPDKNHVVSAEPLPEFVISKESICSKFVAEAYQSACHRMTNHDRDRFDYQQQLMNISPWTVPKTLQAYLYRNTNYDYFVMPHDRGEIYNLLKEVVMKEIRRLFPLVENNDLAFPVTPAQRKGKDLFDALQRFDMVERHESNSITNAIMLLKELAPILRRNTRNDFVTPTSFRRVMSFAKKAGIYQENFRFELHDRAEGKIRELAHKVYGFNEPLAKLYRDYRRIGYSDDEAKFECRPSFGDWFKISPARNALLTCTIVGFFVWVLPRGLRRTDDAKKRNEALTHQQLSAPAI